MFHDAVGFVVGHCDIRTLGALESLSQNFRACATGNALWRDLLKDRSPSLGKQPGIFARQVLKQMVQFVPMHMRPFPTSVAQLSSAELREYYWCVDVQHFCRAKLAHTRRRTSHDTTRANLRSRARVGR